MSGIRIVVAGAAGRMGKAVIGAIEQAADCTLSAAIRRGEDPAPLLTGADVLIEFTEPRAAVALAQAAVRAQVPLVSGTTGLSPEEDAKIRATARSIPVLRSGNMSAGVALLASFARQAARALPGFDIEILDIHHRHKKDAPSGTALLLGKAAAEGRGLAPGEGRLRDAQSPARKDGEIGYVSLRGGSVVGEHEVIFAGPSERLVLRHIAEDRAIFANGALSAARWIVGKKPGLYAMTDVLGL